MAKRERPNGLVTAENVQKVIMRSMESAENFAQQVDEKFYNLEERLDQLRELLDIVWELTWRYGDENRVRFIFSNKKKISDSMEISEIVETTYWAKRLWVVEDYKKGTALVYVNF